ncbi:MAG: MATE family efflux transporter [Chitinispirillaceae bacterium]|nr:MATE family efflux transporter [Chitinispirillaceae bacterium]
MPPNKSGRDCTTGSIPRHLLAVAAPMLIGNFIQSGYAIIDAVWVGRVVGKEAIGAIAVSFPVLFLFIAVAAGATMATTILISQYFGAGNLEQVKKTIGASIFFAILLSVVISTAGIFTTDHILRLLKTPESIIPAASQYLKINFGGFLIMYCGFLIGSILRGIGDSKTPLYFMIVGVAVNAVLDPLLIIGVGPFPRLGLGGAAVASICGQLIATIIGYGYLRKKKNIVAVDLHLIGWNPEKIRLIMKIGFPSMLQQSAVSLGMATITSIVNGFGDTATAAFGAAGRIDTVSMFPAMSIGMAVSIISGQNIGAGKHARVRQVFKWGMFMTVAVSLFFTFFYLTIPKFLLSAFLSDPDVLAIGANFLRIVGPGELFFAMAFVANGVINGAGHTRVTLVFTILALWGVRVPAAKFLSETGLGINGIWLGTVFGFFTSMLLSTIWYFSGRWTRQVIKTRSAT